MTHSTVIKPTSQISPGALSLLIPKYFSNPSPSSPSPGACFQFRVSLLFFLGSNSFLTGLFTYSCQIIASIFLDHKSDPVTFLFKTSFSRSPLFIERCPNSWLSRVWSPTIHLLPFILLPYQPLIPQMHCPLSGLASLHLLCPLLGITFSSSACLTNYYSLRPISLWKLHWITGKLPPLDYRDLYDLSVFGSHKSSLNFRLTPKFFQAPNTHFPSFEPFPM